MKTAITIVYAIVLLLGGHTAAQEGDMWSKFAKAKWVSKLNETEGVYYYYPHFGYDLRVIEGSTVQIEGYYLPYELAPGSFILSKLPMASCFFCGGAGPESVVQVNLVQKRKFRTDQVLKIEGKLRLNADDLDQLNFIIDEARVVETLK